MGTSVTALWWLMIILSGLGRLRPFALRLGNCLELACWWRPELFCCHRLCLPSVSAHFSFLTYLSFVILHSRSLLYSLRFLPWPLSGILQLSSHCCFSCCHQGGNHHHCLCPIAALVLLQLASCSFTTRSTVEKDKSRPRTWWERHLITASYLRAALMGVSWPPWRVGCWKQGWLHSLGTAILTN